MALAFLRFRGEDDRHYVFHADIGTAKYFRYVIGEKKQKLRVALNEHIEVLSGNKKASGLLQINVAMHKIHQGRFPLKIPKSERGDGLDYVQLYSYGSRTVKAPTISEIVRLYPRTEGIRNGNSRMRRLGLSLTDQQIKANGMQDIEVKNEAFSYQEPPLSKVMFWNALVGALPALVQHAAPIIGGLLNQGSTNTNASAGETGAATNTRSEEVINKVVEVLQAINTANNSASTPVSSTPATAVAEAEVSTASAFGAPAATVIMDPEAPVSETSTGYNLSPNPMSSAYGLAPETLIQLKPILEKILSPEAILAVGDEPRKLFLAIKDAVHKTETEEPSGTAATKKNTLSGNNDPEFSETKAVSAALLAALPALMPVIEKVIDPKTIEAIGNQPVKLLKAIGDSVLKMDEQQYKHLEAINPGVDSADDIAKLLQGMSISSELYEQDLIRFKMIKNLNLEFVNTRTVRFKNKNRVLYGKHQRIVIPFKIVSDTGTILNKTLRRSIVQIVIKNAKTLEMVFRKNIKLIDVSLATTINETFLSPEEVKNIPCNTELKFELSHIWKSNKNENIGVFKSHYIHLVDTYIFDRIGERIGEPVPFNDIQLHRKYWHKIWEGGFSKSNRWHVQFDLKYYYLLDAEKKGISRLETRKMITDDNVEEGREHPGRRKVDAKLKSGLAFGLDAINNTLALLKQETLNEEKLRILRKSTVAESFQQVARQRLEIKGREGDTATLWSYPEMVLYKLHFSKIGQVDDYGQVISLQAEDNVIPKADILHFIGTKSER